jgi:hypothetical protein
MDEQQALSKMVSPGMRREVYLGGICQILITRACDKACFHCTQGSNLGGKPVMISLEDFETACASLQDYFGVVGIFGGNPALHPKFPEICEILEHYIPFQQRGLWCNHPKGHGKLMRRVFNPAHSNINVHQDQEAWDEFKRDWPELLRHRPDQFKGLDGDSRHSPPFVAMLDVVPDEAERWRLIADCDINKFWSAIVCPVPNAGVRAFFCELAGAQAMLHGNDPTWPDLGLPVTPGWWRKPMEEFAAQVRHYCHRCGVPLRRYGQLANGGEYEEVSATHQDIYSPKVKGREVRLVELDGGPRLEVATNYIQNGQV